MKQKEEKDDLSEKIAERTQELIAEDRAEPQKEERNINTDVMKLVAATRGLKIDPEWTREEAIKTISEYSGLPEEEIEVLLESTTKFVQETAKSITEAFERLKPAFEQMGKAITESFKKLNWSGLLSRKEMISNNKRKMKGMPMIRAKAFKKQERIKGESLRSREEGVQCAKWR